MIESIKKREVIVLWFDISKGVLLSKWCTFWKFYVKVFCVLLIMHIIVAALFLKEIVEHDMEFIISHSYLELRGDRLQSP